MTVLEKLEGKYMFVMEMEVRDYELDCESIVNNANYLHYMEHTRHKYCIAMGTPFAELYRKGIEAVVRKVEIVYLAPLRSCEAFYSALNVERKGPRFIFEQAIFKTDGTPVTKATVTVASLVDGKLSRGDEMASYFNL